MDLRGRVHAAGVSLAHLSGCDGSGSHSLCYADGWGRSEFRYLHIMRWVRTESDWPTVILDNGMSALAGTR